MPMADKRDVAGLAILAEPLQPSSFARCVKCRRWFAMKLVQKEAHPLCGTVSTFRCKYCGNEETFTSHHPPHAI
jgi:hypothetical protein